MKQITPSKLLFGLATMLLTLSSCQKDLLVKSPVKEFKIKQGNHSSSNRIFGLTTDISGEFLFTESCRYNHNNVNQLDWNKLIGFNFGTDHHSKNSGRIGWRYRPEYDLVELGYYIRKNGEIKYGSLYFVRINEWFNAGVKKVSKGRVSLYAGDGNYYTDMSKKWLQFNYILQPYFGGDEVAPQDVIIKYKNLRR